MHVMETEEAIAECSAKSENNKINLLDNSVTIIETSSTITTTTATSTTTAISEETPKSPSQNVVIPVKEIKPVEVDIELQEEEDEDIVELISDSEKEKTKVVEENAEEKTKKEKSKNDEKPEEEKIKTIVLDIDIEENQAVDLTQENNRKTNREIENIIKNISDATNAENIIKKQINEKTSIKNKETSSKEITTDPLILSIRASEKTNQIIKIEPSSSPDSVVCSKQTDEETPKTVNVSGATKRPLSPQSLDYTNPTKKHCDEIVTNFDSQNKILSEYLEKTSNESPDELKKHILHIEEEIHTLDDLLKTKEQEWNNMLHLKKMKEEILERLTRKKRINDIRSILIGPEDYRKKSTPTTTQSTITATVKDYSHGAGNLSNNSVSSVCSNSSTLNPTTAQSILHCRANMKSADLVKEKLNTARLQRNILPKTSHCSNQKFLNFSTINSQQQQQTKKNLNDFLNGHQTPMGRQGAIKDVQSIIADFRQKHPEAVPRRGRRLRPSFSINDLSTSQRKSTENRMSELGILLTNVEGVESRPSSADSSHSNSNSVSTNNNNNNNMTPVSNAVSFKDVLVKFAKMTPSERQMLNTGNSSNLLSTLNNSNNSIGGPVVKPPPPYPEVTLHPLNSHSDQNSSAQTSSHTNSLLHGILTKQSTGRPANVYNSFSPTLARLLTAPERINPQASKHYHTQSQQSSVAAGVNLTKNHNEITITPVVNNQSIQQTLYQQQKQDNANLHNRMKSETFNLISADEEADDSVDRLVIDEGDSASDHQNISLSATGQEFHENEVPECQGCKKREAQFVCAGCGNQWYCSRDCQVMAWDEHSEICTG